MTARGRRKVRSRRREIAWASQGRVRPDDDPPVEEVERDASGAIVRGPSLVCGCPLDSGCDGQHPGRLP
jgi:hypothetical protein